MKRLFTTTLVLFMSVVLLLAGEAKKKVTGKVFEVVNNEKVALAFANVFIEGTTTGTVTDFDGNFSLDLEAGTYQMVFSSLGYKAVTRTIEVTADGELTIDTTLEVDGEELEEVQVVAKANRESENMLLMEQKHSAVAVEAIGAKELAVKGVSDAAGAVTKVTGISKQEGTGTLNVRGLGDRYNTTTLNRLPIPSNNAEVKNVDLSLFSTDVISTVNIEKTYAAPLFGDFGGANIDIASKKLTGTDFFTVSVKGSQNSSLFDVDNFYLTDGPSKSGFYNSELPNTADLRSNTNYAFEHSWDPKETDVIPNIGVGIAGGKTVELNSNSELKVFGTVSFDNKKNFTERIDRSVGAVVLSETGGVNSYKRNAKGEEYSYETQTTAMLNVNYSKPNNDIYFNSLFLNSSEEQFTRLYGQVTGEIDEGLKQRSDFERNMIVVNQLLGEHYFDNHFSVDWGVAYNYLWNVVPDRRNLVYQDYDKTTERGELNTESAGDNFRYYRDFLDNEVAGNLVAYKEFGVDDNGYKSKLTVGYSGKYKTRDFINTQVNHAVEDVDIDATNVDGYLNNENFVNGEFNVVIVNPRDENGEFVDGEDYKGLTMVNSLFGQFEYNLTDRFMIMLGVRAEQVKQEITVRSTQISRLVDNRTINQETFEFDEFKILPSLIMKYSLTDKSNLRFAASKTYTLPQLQEMPFMSFSGISDVVFGNPYLKPSDVYNADIKWEAFPKNGELLSITGFGKYIIDPMNKTAVNGQDGTYATVNTGDWAYAYGVELDMKKDLYKLDGKKVFASANLSLMNTKTELNKDKVREETENKFNAPFNDTEGELQGAAPVLANVALGYSQRWDEKKSFSASMVYNFTSDRLFAYGYNGIGDEYEKAIHTLDFVLKTKLGKKGQYGIDFKAKNILNQDYTREVRNRIEENADHIVRQYKRGTDFSVSLKYNF